MTKIPPKNTKMAPSFFPPKITKSFFFSIFGIIFVFFGGIFVFFGGKTVGPFLYFCFFFFFWGDFCFFGGKKKWGGIFVFFGGIFVFSGLVFNMILYLNEEG
jgi:hypothetical protein